MLKKIKKEEIFKRFLNRIGQPLKITPSRKGFLSADKSFLYVVKTNKIVFSANKTLYSGDEYSTEESFYTYSVVEESGFIKIKDEEDFSILVLESKDVLKIDKTSKLCSSNFNGNLFSSLMELQTNKNKDKDKLVSMSA